MKTFKEFVSENEKHYGVNEESEDRHTFSNYREWKTHVENLTPTAKKKPSFVLGADSAAAFIGDTHIGRFEKNSGYVLKDIPQKRARKPKSE